MFSLRTPVPPLQFGQFNEFGIKAADVGPIASVSISLDAVGNMSSWRPKQVEVLNKVTDSYGLFKNNEELIYYWNGPAELTQVRGVSGLGLVHPYLRVVRSTSGLISIKTKQCTNSHLGDCEYASMINSHVKLSLGISYLDQRTLSMCAYVSIVLRSPRRRDSPPWQ